MAAGFEGDALNLEVTIYETGVSPQFRVFPLTPAGVPIPVRDVQLEVALTRLGGEVTQDIPFTPELDYLRGTETVEEPHSFAVRLTARFVERPKRFPMPRKKAGRRFLMRR